MTQLANPLQQGRMPYHAITGAGNLKGIAPIKHHIPPYGALANTTPGNDYKVRLDIGGETYTFASSENAYHALKLHEFAQRNPTKNAQVKAILRDLEKEDSFKEGGKNFKEFLEKKDTNSSNNNRLEDLGLSSYGTGNNSFTEKTKFLHQAPSTGGLPPKYKLMEQVVRAKLQQHPELMEVAKKAAKDGIMPVEVTPVDEAWGAGPRGNGKNYLGRIIYQIGLEELDQTVDRSDVAAMLLHRNSCRDKATNAYQNIPSAQLKHSALQDYVTPDASGTQAKKAMGSMTGLSPLGNAKAGEDTVVLNFKDKASIGTDNDKLYDDNGQNPSLSLDFADADSKQKLGRVIAKGLNIATDDASLLSAKSTNANLQGELDKIKEFIKAPDAQQKKDKFKLLDKDIKLGIIQQLLSEQKQTEIDALLDNNEKISLMAEARRLPDTNAFMQKPTPPQQQQNNTGLTGTETELPKKDALTSILDGATVTEATHNNKPYLKAKVDIGGGKTFNINVGKKSVNLDDAQFNSLNAAEKKAVAKNMLKAYLHKHLQDVTPPWDGNFSSLSQPQFQSKLQNLNPKFKSTDKDGNPSNSNVQHELKELCSNLCQENNFKLGNTLPASPQPPQPSHTTVTGLN